MTRYRVFDPEGKVKDWIDIGRTVHVWRNEDLSSPRVGTLSFTATVDGQPIRPPHWQYGTTPIHSTTNAADFLFFAPIGVASGLVHVKESGSPNFVTGEGTHVQIVPKTRFSESAAGMKAAHRAADKLAEATPENGVIVPIGRKFNAYTVQALDFESTAKRTDGKPLAYHHEWCVIEWSLIEPIEATESAAS